MAFFGKSSSDSGMAALTKSSALQARKGFESSDAILLLGLTLPGTGFETLPPLAILFKPFQFLKCLGLNSVGLGLDCIPFHYGWELVEWRPKLHAVEVLEICDEVEEEEPLEVFGPQIELNLSNPTNIGEPPVEADEVAPAVVVEVEEESSVEVVEAKASVEKKEGDQAKGTGSEPVLDSVEKELRNQV